MKFLLAATVALAAGSGAAQAQTIRLLHSIPVFFTCLAQDPDRAESHLKAMAQGEESQEKIRHESFPDRGRPAVPPPCPE